VGQLKFAANQPAIVAKQADNVVRLDAWRRASHVRSAGDVQPRSSEGVVMRLPLANEGTRQKAAGTDESIAREKAKSSGASDTGFTTIDFVATAFLILSVFAAPALVWTLLRSASFG
jgi:hypothetical protein